MIIINIILLLLLLLLIIIIIISSNSITTAEMPVSDGWKSLFLALADNNDCERYYLFVYCVQDPVCGQTSRILMLWGQCSCFQTLFTKSSVSLPQPFGKYIRCQCWSRSCKESEFSWLLLVTPSVVVAKMTVHEGSAEDKKLLFKWSRQSKWSKCVLSHLCHETLFLIFPFSTLTPFSVQRTSQPETHPHLKVACPPSYGQDQSVCQPASNSGYSTKGKVPTKHHLFRKWDNRL